MKKPVSKKGKLSNKKGETFNYNNKGYSGAALIIPKKENGGKNDSNTTSDIIYNGYINSGLEGLLSSQEYRDLYNSGRLMSYDKNTDTYTAPPLKEVVITAKAPQWLKYEREYEKNNPKSDYIRQYLDPFARSLGNTETNYPKRLDDEYYNNLYSSYIDKLFNDFSFEFSDKEQELVDKYPKTERDKSAYKYFKEKNQDKKWQDEYLEAVKDLTFDTFTDQLPDIAKKYQGNPYIDKILKLPHMNKLKSGYQLLYEGRPLSALSELVKIPKFSSITTDALINLLQENPEGYDLKNLEDKFISPVRLAGIKNEQIIRDIGKEIIRSGKTKNSSWKLREYNLPDLVTASKAFSKKYNTDQNDFVEFIENYMVGRNKTYKETLEAYDKYLQSQQNKGIDKTKYDVGGKIIPYDPKDRKFKEWYNKNTLEGQNKIPYSERLDYDYYSFYKNGEYRNKMFNIENHFPDTYKRPNHKTFSNESIYSTRENPGGIWRGEEFIPQYDPGGTVGPYQMIQPSIYPQNYGINSPYFSQQPPLFDGQVGSPYYSTHDDYSQYGITNNIQPILPKGLKKLQIPSPSEYPSNTLNRISRDLMQRDPLAKSTPSTSAKSIGSAVAGMGGSGGGIPGIDPISAGITMAANVASATYDTTNMLMQNLSKEDSATRGWADASTRATKYADAVTSIVNDIPVVGPVARAVGKNLSFWIAGPAGARSANIRKKEMKYTTDLNEFNERNSQTVLAPNNYNNYRAEFGINTGTKNNPLIEEILNDFRNYLAQIQNT